MANDLPFRFTAVCKLSWVVCVVVLRAKKEQSPKKARKMSLVSNLGVPNSCATVSFWGLLGLPKKLDTIFRGSPRIRWRFPTMEVTLQ